MGSILQKDYLNSFGIVWRNLGYDSKNRKIRYKNLGCIRKLVEYIMTDKKGEHVRFFGGTGVDYIFYEETYKQIRTVKKNFKKLSGIQVWHYMLSFPFSPSRENTYTVYKIGMEIINTCFCDYQTIFGVHEETGHIHIHFLINSVSFRDGRKWHLTIQESSMLKEYIENMANEYFFKSDT